MANVPFFLDTFGGAAGPLNGHAPNNPPDVHGAVWATTALPRISGSNSAYGGIGSVSGANQILIPGFDANAGAYFEYDFLWGTAIGFGGGEAQFSAFFNLYNNSSSSISYASASFTLRSGNGYAFFTMTDPGSGGGYIDVAATPDSSPHTLRGECDIAAQSLRFYYDGSLLGTIALTQPQDSTPTDIATVSLNLTGESRAYNPGTTLPTLITRLAFGALTPPTAPVTPAFWTSLRATREVV